VENLARLIQKIGACPRLDRGWSPPYPVRSVGKSCGSSASSKTGRSSRPSWNTWGCGSSNQDPLPRSMPHLLDTSGIISLQSPSTTITFLATQTIPGMLPSAVKIRNTGRAEPVCPDEPQKSLPDLGKSLKAPLSTSTPKTLRIPAEKAP